MALAFLERVLLPALLPPPSCDNVGALALPLRPSDSVFFVPPSPQPPTKQQNSEWWVWPPKSNETSNLEWRWQQRERTEPLAQEREDAELADSLPPRWETSIWQALDAIRDIGQETGNGGDRKEKRFLVIIDSLFDLLDGLIHRPTDLLARPSTAVSVIFKVFLC
eukprot:GABV01008562.1.p3 GENE.GABV01008562.1~~GABV01008562.1.p3  ORF type:complete len:165 (-),score=44.18 GABV01008562.1:454-948(-)